MTISFARHQFPPAIIRHGAWLYVRFTLSYRDVEDLLAERGLDVSYPTVRRVHLGNQTNASSIRSRRRSLCRLVRGCLLGTASSTCCKATLMWSNSGSAFGIKLTNPASKRPDLMASNCSKLAAG